MALDRFFKAIDSSENWFERVTKRKHLSMLIFRKVRDFKAEFELHCLIVNVGERSFILGNTVKVSLIVEATTLPR